MSRARNELRIIGGQWRGRRIRFPELAAIRPSPDRVRETLFNWLQHDIAGARCLDLFAGSGALGFEALSRGAAEVTFCDSQRAVAEHLRKTLLTLGSSNAGLGNAIIKNQDAHEFLASAATVFDIIFLDPPFSENILPRICSALESKGWLANPALIYLESPAKAGVPRLPDAWTVLKSKQAGEVGYHLVRRAVGHLATTRGDSRGTP